MTETSITELQPPTRGAWYQGTQPLQRNSLAPPQQPLSQNTQIYLVANTMACWWTGAAEGPAAFEWQDEYGVKS